MGIPTSMCFSAIFMNGNNFYGVYLSFKDDILLLNGVYSERKEFAPLGANIFFKS